MEKKDFICIVCPIGCNIEVKFEGKGIRSISGNKCFKGKEFVIAEIIHPQRVLTTTVKVKNGENKLLPVKTDRPVSKELIFKIMKEVRQIEVKAPIKINQVIVENILETGANLIAERSIRKKN